MTDNPFNLNYKPALIPDTKPVKGLGEATLKPCPFGCVHAFLPAVDMSPDDDRYVYCTVCGACAQREVWEKRPIEDALKQRVKVLEVGFQNVLNVLGPNVPSHLKGCPGCQEEWAEAIRIAREALDLQCGNCGDDGEEPSKNCPTCHGTGFKALAPPVGEKEK